MMFIFQRIVDALSKIYARLRCLIEPPATIQNPENRHRARLLNILTLIFVPGSILIATVESLLDHEALYTIDPALVATSLAVVILTMVFIVIRRGYYRAGAWLIIGAGGGVIIINAVYAIVSTTESYSPANILYLLLMTLLASMLFGEKETLVVSLIVLFIGFVLVTFVGDYSSDIRFDSVLLLIVLQTFIFIATHLRNVLEQDRRRELAQHSAQMDMFFNQIPAMVWTVDANFNITSATGTNLKASDLREQFAASLFTTRHVRHHEYALAGQPITYEMKWQNVPYYVNLEPLKDEETQQIIGCVGIAIDISERITAEERRMQLISERERAKVISQFVRSASHDFKTPLSIINTSLYMIERVDDAQRRKEKIEVIGTQVNNITKIIDGLLEATQVDTGNFHTFRQVNINRVFEIALAEKSKEINHKQLTVDKQFAQDLPLVMAVEFDLNRAFIHILQNAVQNTPDQGLITIKTRHEKSYILIDIQDSGKGIPEEDLPYIFDHFYRVEKHRPADDANLGLGLPITKRIIEQHGGIITVDSQFGIGTTVHISLPTFPIRRPDDDAS